MAMGTVTFKKNPKSNWDHKFAQKSSHPSAFSIIEFCVCRLEIMADGGEGGIREEI